MNKRSITRVTCDNDIKQETSLPKKEKEKNPETYYVRSVNETNLDMSEFATLYDYEYNIHLSGNEIENAYCVLAHKPDKNMYENIKMIK